VSRGYTFISRNVTIKLHDGNSRTSRKEKQRTFFNQVYQKVSLGTYISKTVF